MTDHEFKGWDISEVAEPFGIPYNESDYDDDSWPEFEAFIGTQWDDPDPESASVMREYLRALAATDHSYDSHVYTAIADITDDWTMWGWVFYNYKRMWS
jgi:hypothetical protein